jgi:uncharacterized protein (DUF488 family)
VSSGFIVTIGHSSRSLDDFVRLLRREKIATLIDVRRFAGSKRYPHFAARALGDSLVFEGVGYFHEPDLGGMRKSVPSSVNDALDDAFRGYADHMATPAFRAAFERVARLAGRELVALMCAEANPERCHRRYLADAFAIAGFDVRHVLDEGTRAHVLHSALTRRDGIIVYKRRGQLELFR